MKPVSEIQIQAEAFQRLNRDYPETRGKCFAVPNGGARNKVEGMQLKASGTVAGIPDVLLVWHGRVFGFEFKTASGIISPAQEKIHQIWREDGTPVYIIRDSDTFISIVEEITGLRTKLKQTG